MVASRARACPNSENVARKAGLKACTTTDVAPKAGLKTCTTTDIAPKAGLKACTTTDVARKAGLKACTTTDVAPKAGLKACTTTDVAPKAGLKACTTTDVTHAESYAAPMESEAADVVASPHEESLVVFCVPGRRDRLRWRTFSFTMVPSAQPSTAVGTTIVTNGTFNLKF